MNCEQKSGVFLSIACVRPVAKKCANCEKQVCKTHCRTLENRQLCEDCYWEAFLYYEEKKTTTKPIDDDDTAVIFTGSSTDSTSSSTATEEGFAGGFGGGEFGGGGASGEWTGTDMKGFDETDANGGLLDTDETFYYS